jgi:DNA-binding response OmpR family regulator
MQPGTHAQTPHRKVLVVDDDANARAAVTRILQDEGYDAAQAADGEEAFSLLGAFRPDLVLTDLHMPRLDGRGLLLRVRAVLPGTPVIVLSAQGGTEAISLTGRMGAAAVFRKPVQLDDLLGRIRELIGR